MMTSNTAKTVTITIAFILVGAIMSGCVDNAPTKTVAEETEIEYDVPVGTANGESHTTPTPEVTPIPDPTSEPTSIALKLEIGESAETSNLRVLVTSYKTMREYVWYGSSGYLHQEDPKYGNLFIVFDCEIENIGDTREFAGSMDFSMSDNESYRYDPSYVYYGDDRLDSITELYPGQKMKGKVMFEIPATSTKNKLYYDFGTLFGINLAEWNVMIE